MSLSPSALQRRECSNPHFTDEQLMDRVTRIWILKSAPFRHLDLLSCSYTAQESRGQNTELLCDSLAALGLPAALARWTCTCSSAPRARMHCPSQRPLSHMMSHACREPAADWQTWLYWRTLQDIWWGALKTYIQLCPGPPGSSADACACACSKAQCTLASPLKLWTKARSKLILKPQHRTSLSRWSGHK